MAEVVTVGYWDCRGLVQPIILILEYLKKPYKFETPSKNLIGPPPNFDKTKWYSAKNSLLKGYAFPNLPHYHDPELGIKLTQSSAIMMHLGRSNGLFPDENDLKNM